MTVWDALVTGVPSDPAGRVSVGFNWTAVEGPSATGFAATPNRADGAHTTAETGTYSGRPLRELAALLTRDNPYERAIGLAAANAHWNTDRPDLADGDGLDSADPARTVIVGRFPQLERKLPGAVVLERSPGPNDRPAEDAPLVIPEARALIITATTLVNGTLASLLDLAGRQTRVTLVGPGTPLCAALFEHGIHSLAGFVAVDRDGAF